jgi:hypothetical protein
LFDLDEFWKLALMLTCSNPCKCRSCSWEQVLREMAAELSTSCFVSLKGFLRTAAVLSWVLLISGVDAQNGTSDVQTLLRFKTSLEGDSGVLTIGKWSTWNASDQHPRKWWGVICTSNFTVEKLDLSNWGLTHVPHSVCYQAFRIFETWTCHRTFSYMGPPSLIIGFQSQTMLDH